MRSFGLVLFVVLIGCYAVPAEHDIQTSPVTDDAGEEAGEPEMDAGNGGLDAEPSADAEDPADARMDGAKDGPHDGSFSDATDASGVAADASDASDAHLSPCGLCSDPSKPHCATGSKTCVACTAHEHCGANRYCTALSECVDCRSNADCTSPAASVCDTSQGKCVACADGNDGQCGHIVGKNVCASGECVQCTKDKRSACKTSDGKPAACDNAMRACTAYEVGGTPLCGECVSDAQCQPGSRCVQTTYAGTGQVVGWHCQWQQGAGGGAPVACDSTPPFVGTKQLGSIDAPAEVRDMCVLRATTCAAFNRYGTRCGRYTRAGSSFIVANVYDSQLPLAEQGGAAKPYISPDDSVCGGVGAKCVAQNPSTAAYSCTIGCLGPGSSDCKTGTMCAIGTPDWCSVN